MSDLRDRMDDPLDMKGRQVRHKACQCLCRDYEIITYDLSGSTTLKCIACGTIKEVKL
jgi:hypothetical protein